MAALASEAADAEVARRVRIDPGSESLLCVLMDEFAHGIIVAETDARILHANQAARHELGQQQAILVEGGRLHAASTDSVAALHDALLRAADGKRSLIELCGVRHRSLTLAVLPLRCEAAVPVPRAALIFARATVCDSLMLCFFARSHGLTGAEEQVLAMLCQGFSAPQTARQLKVAVSTIRSHVRSLCAKTRSSGVRELVTRLAVLPPVASAFFHEPVH